MANDIDKLARAHRENVHKPPEHFVHQWHAAIDDAAALERGRLQAPRRDRRWIGFFGLAVTAALALGIGIGTLIGEDDRDAGIETAQPMMTADVTADAFSRGLQYYLRDSRAQLVSLDTETDATMLVLEIIAQNRLYERAAEQHDAPRVARVLRAFEPILLRLAADDIAPQDAEALRAQLAFELNVMLTKLARDASDQTHTT